MAAIFKNITLLVLFAAGGMLYIFHYYNGSEMPDMYILSAIKDGSYGGGEGYNYANLPCKQAVDSIEEIKEYQKYQLKGSYSGFGGVIGVCRVRECDTCTSIRNLYASGDDKKYYLRLGGYRLRPEKEFFIKQGKYYLISKTIKRTKYDNDAYSESETDRKTEQIPVRYSTDLKDLGSSNGKTDRALLIPISQQYFIYYQIIGYSLLALLVLASVIAFIVFPINILYNIAKGQPFTSANIRQLNIIGWFLLGMSLLTPLISASFQVFLHDLISPGFYFPIWEAMQENKSVIITGAIILLIARAFKSGHKLQQEQDLTV